MMTEFHIPEAELRALYSEQIEKNLGHPLEVTTFESLIGIAKDSQAKQAALGKQLNDGEITFETGYDKLSEIISSDEERGEALLGHEQYVKIFGEKKPNPLPDRETFVADLRSQLSSPAP